MKKHLLSLIALALVNFCSFGQISHDLEIYSEDGLMFTLILNGRKMNETPVSNIQITNTDKDYFNAKIIFEDTTIPSIEKKILQISGSGDQANIPVSVVYKIINKKEEYKLAFASRSAKKIQEQQDVIIINNNPPVNGKIVISW